MGQYVRSTGVRSSYCYCNTSRLAKHSVEIEIQCRYIVRPAPVVTSLDLKVESATPRQNGIWEEQDEMFELKVKFMSTFAKRQSPDARKSTLELFRQIYSSIEQEMLREEDPYSTACHDPYIEKLLEKLLVSVDNGGVQFDGHKLIARIATRFRIIAKYRATTRSTRNCS